MNACETIVLTEQLYCQTCLSEDEPVGVRNLVQSPGQSYTYKGLRIFLGGGGCQAEKNNGWSYPDCVDKQESQVGQGYESHLNSASGRKRCNSVLRSIQPGQQYK